MTAPSRPLPHGARPSPEAPARRFGVRAALAAAAALVAAGPLTLVVVLILTRSPGLRSLDASVATSLHSYVAARPALGQTLGVGSVVLHPRVMWVVAGVTAAVLWRRDRHRHAVWVVVTVAVGGALDTPLKELIRRSRPVFDTPITTAPGYSFPSGHALNSMLIAAGAVVLGWRATRGRPWRRTALLGGATLLVLVTGFDRVGLGVHYTSDVVGGWLIGLAVVCATTAAFSTGVAPQERDEGEPADPDHRSPS